MIYQIGIILILVVVAIVASKKFFNKDLNDDLVYEDEMDEKELEELDKETSQLILTEAIYRTVCMQIRQSLQKELL